jgi:hypothetical protein
MNKKYIPFVSLFFIVFISRIPFLYAGYGIEEDSWGIALAAFHTHLSGVYEPSRFPGHPVQELIYSALWGSGPLVFNGLCALLSAVAVVFFSFILKHFQFRHYMLAALAFAFIPVYFISSTYTIDFVWTEAFVMIALYLLLKEKLILSGIFLGLAVGCRITSGAMLLPFIIIIWQQNNLKLNVINFLKLAFPLAVVAVLFFMPLIIQFGTSFFMYYDQFQYPPITKVLYKMIVGVFGLVGVVAVLAGVVLMFTKQAKQERGSLFEHTLSKKVIYASVLILILYSISYFRLPQKSGYMIAVLPFVLVLFGYYLRSIQFKWLCYALILSPFVCSINLTDKLRGAEYSKYAVVVTVSGQELFFDPFTGPVFSDLSKRVQKINYTNEVIQKTQSLTSKTVIISGWWYNEIMVTMIPMSKNNLVVFEPYIDSKKINEYLAHDYTILYLPEQNIYNDEMFKMSLTNEAAKPFNL